MELHNQNNKWNCELSSDIPIVDRNIYSTAQVLNLDYIGPFYNYLINIIYIVPFGLKTAERDEVPYNPSNYCNIFIYIIKPTVKGDPKADQNFPVVHTLPPG